MTTDPIIQAAYDRLQELAVERRELESFIEMHKRLAKNLKPASEQKPPFVPRVTTLPPAAFAPTPSTTNEILEAVDKVLRAHGRPMPLAAVHEAIEAAGIVIVGKDPRNNLSSKLYASAKFATRRGVGWWFANEWPQEKRLSEAESG